MAGGEGSSVTQHYQKNVVETPHWCNHCTALTRWRVLNGKLAFCIPCWDRSAADSAAKKNEPKEEKPKQGDLFG